MLANLLVSVPVDILNDIITQKHRLTCILKQNCAMKGKGEHKLLGNSITFFF